MYIPFDEMSASSRVWLYQSDRPFTEDERQWVNSKLKAFCDTWNTHGNLMHTSFDIRHNQFILLSVDESVLGASGCSIDSSVRTIREIEEKLGVNLLDAGKVSILEGDEVSVSRFAEIKDKILAGKIHADSKLVNPSINRKEDLSSRWVIPAKDSWLKRYFNH